MQTLGRLTDPAQFGDIIVKSDGAGRVTRLRDIGRVELGAQDYGANGYLDTREAVPLLIFQQPGSNALATASGVRDDDAGAVAATSRKACATTSSTTPHSSSPNRCARW